MQIRILTNIILSAVLVAAPARILKANEEGTMGRFAVKSTDGEYNSPIIGNGEVVTVLGPTGYHNGFCPEEERVNRTLFWAGRRLRDARSADIRIPRVPPEELIGPTIPLIRFGRLHRVLRINGEACEDDVWTQTLDPEKGTVHSELEHDGILERTRSLVCLTENVLIFRTGLVNSRDVEADVEFWLDYVFGDAEGERAAGTRLHIRRPHPDDLGFGNVEGVRSVETDLASRPPHLRESLSVAYEIEGHLGEVHLGRYPNGVIRDTETGGRFIHQVTLAPGESHELMFWVVLSDRTKYTHYPEYGRVLELVAKHERAWAKFWGRSRVQLNDAQIDAVRTTCLYTLRCNASPWSIPPGYLSTTWEGRTFHDEFYPFLAMISSNHPELAVRIPNYRLATLPVARRRAAGHGAYYAWEATELGEESAPYGHWTDERFIHGQFSEQAWRYYLHTRNIEDLRRFYPVMRGCALWMIHDVLERDETGRLRGRVIADISEHVITAQNTIFAGCAAVRSLENAARAAELLDVDATERETWLALAEELKSNLPRSGDGTVYRYADDTDTPFESAHLGMVFPFPFDVDGEAAAETLKRAYDIYLSSRAEAAASETVFSYNWIWAVGRLAAICFYQGKADWGYDVLQQAPKTLGPFMAPNEHYRETGGAFLPWFTSGAGAFVYAINAMFVQVWDQGPAILCPALPRDASGIRFENLLTTHGVTLSGEIDRGQVVSLAATADREMEWRFRLPQSVADQVRLVQKAVADGRDSAGRIICRIRLNAGENSLLQ